MAAAVAPIAAFEKLVTDTEQTLSQDNIVSKLRKKLRLSCENYRINLRQIVILVKFLLNGRLTSDMVILRLGSQGSGDALRGSPIAKKSIVYN
jgi:hypothetical protein